MSPRATDNTQKQTPRGKLSYIGKLIASQEEEGCRDHKRKIENVETFRGDSSAACACRGSWKTCPRALRAVFYKLDVGKSAKKGLEKLLPPNVIRRMRRDRRISGLLWLERKQSRKCGDGHPRTAIKKTKCAVIWCVAKFIVKWTYNFGLVRSKYPTFSFAYIISTYNSFLVDVCYTQKILSKLELKYFIFLM